MDEEEGMKNVREIMKLAEKVENYGYSYASFCEEVAEWGKKNDPEHDGHYPTEREISHAHEKLREIEREVKEVE